MFWELVPLKLIGIISELKLGYCLGMELFLVRQRLIKECGWLGLVTHACERWKIVSKLGSGVLAWDLVHRVSGRWFWAHML
jgi:hypothetical protein